MKSARPNVKLVVFDLDGTVVDAFGDIAAAANWALQRLGRASLPAEHIKQGVGNGVRALMRYCLNAAAGGGASGGNSGGGAGEESAGSSNSEVSEDEVERAFHLFVEYYQDHNAERAFVLPGVVETLQRLRDLDVRTAVISNKLHPLVVETLQRLNLVGLFDVVAGESERFPRKPAPDVLLHLMKEFGVRPDETLVIGDGPADLALARAAGCRFAGVTTGQLDRAQFEAAGAPVVLDDLSGVVQLVHQR
ncbi:MAG: phosphoglycolate phosphatase [Candidatus Sumerlaeia bacterium]